MSELTKRVVVSLLGAPIALWIVLAGGAPLAALLAIVSAIAAWEFFRIARAAGKHHPQREGRRDDGDDDATSELAHGRAVCRISRVRQTSMISASLALII